MLKHYRSQELCKVSTFVIYLDSNISPAIAANAKALETNLKSAAVYCLSV